MKTDQIETDALIDEALEETFPASDPPSWAARLRVGAPRRGH